MKEEKKEKENKVGEKKMNEIVKKVSLARRRERETENEKKKEVNRKRKVDEE